MPEENKDIIVLEPDKYASKYSESNLFNKIKKTVKNAGLKFGAIALALGLARFYIDDEVKRKAQNKIVRFFGESDLNDLT